jgi:hypothetical protein
LEKFIKIGNFRKSLGWRSLVLTKKNCKCIKYSSDTSILPSKIPAKQVAVGNQGKIDHLGSLPRFHKQPRKNKTL